MPEAVNRLDAEFVRESVVQLQRRISARFERRGLCDTGADLLDLVDRVGASTATSQGRMRVVRIASRLLMLAVVAATAVVVVIAVRDAMENGPERGLDWLPLIESTINDLVFAALAIWFLYSAPERLQRHSTLALLHRLRSLAHIIDMHQLTKDPERYRADFVPTEATEPPDLSLDELERYLDYCSELLSLVSKAAALCAEESEDAVVLDTVSTIEALTVGMSRKIWQKIAMVNQIRHELAGSDRAGADPSV